MKNKHAAALGSLGGKARAKNTSPERLTEIAMMGVAARKAKNAQKPV